MSIGREGGEEGDESNGCGAEIVVCAGPPACPLTDDAAIKNAEDGCTLCRRIIIDPDGTEREYRTKSN